VLAPAEITKSKKLVVGKKLTPIKSNPNKYPENLDPKESPD
jgi:hypothetical protein